jgi:peptidoglycan/xylan/chitin deacetylase (PgdA/CDA1 family)/SAM-dependent methyltransferase
MGFRERAGRIIGLLAQQGLVLIYHQVGRESPDPVHVNVPADLFSAQMEELRRSWNPLSLSDLVQGLEMGNLPRRSVAVTFDDGYVGVLSCALPILERWKIPATVFVTSGSLDGKKEFWWDELQRIVWEAKGEPAGWKWLADEARMRIRPSAAREDAYRILQESLRERPPKAIQAELDRLRKQARVPAKPPRADVRPVTWAECRTLAAHTLITIGAHTVRHPWMSALSEADQRDELEGSRRTLEKGLGRPVRGLAYPFGGRESETADTLRLAREVGFEFACANVKAAVRGSSDRHWIPRITPGDAAGKEFTRRLEEYISSSGSPRIPKGYAGPEKRIREDRRVALDGLRLLQLPQKAAGWAGYRWRNFRAAGGRRKKIRIPVLTFLWARFRLGIGLAPLSVLVGYDRGRPLSRYYLDHFFSEFGSDVHGVVLEFQNDEYASRFGGARVLSLDLLHKEGSGHSKRATIIADLTRPNLLPSNYYDCVICTHVLHLVKDLPKIVSELHRILRPGGILLAAVPMTDAVQPWWHELWRFTPEGLQAILADAFGTKQVAVRGYGNSLIAAGIMRGLTAEEFTRRELDTLDERFAIEVCARAVKA